MRVAKKILIGVAAVAFAVFTITDGVARDAEKSIDELISDLKADRIFGNASDARRDLIRILNPRVAELRPLSRELVPKLEQALLSEDYQQRQNAAALLRRTNGHRPNRALLSVTLEGMRDDSVPHPPQQDRRRVLAGVFGNASEGTEYLAAHLVECKELLEEKLASDCEQQRILCAAILATEGDRDEVVRYVAVFRGGLRSRSEQQRFLSAYLMGLFCIKTDRAEVTGILTEHLKDNRIPWDANLAAEALSYLGVDAHLYLSAAGSSDAQQRRRIQWIRRHAVGKAISNRKVIPGRLRFIWSHRYL